MIVRQNAPGVTPAAIQVGMLPVADLAASATFYCDLFGFELRREFVRDGLITGCSLGRGDLDFALNLRLRSTLAAPADLTAEHPLVWRATDLDTLQNFHRHADSLGLKPIAGEHDDAHFVRVVDPDRTDVLLTVAKRPWDTFCGYEFRGGQYHLAYVEPRLIPGRDNRRPASAGGGLVHTGVGTQWSR